MKDPGDSPKSIDPDDPSIAPLLTFDKSLTGKMAGDSDVRQVLNQARRWLGTRLVTQLNILFKTASVHDRNNKALQGIVSALRSTVESLGEDKPAIIRHQHFFLYLDEQLLQVTTQSISIFMEFIETLNSRGIGGISLSVEAQGDDLLNFAFMLIAADAHHSTCAVLRSQLKERGIRGIELEEVASPTARVGATQAQPGAVAKSLYLKSFATVGESMEMVKEGRRPNLKQAKRVVQSMVDMILQEESIMLGLTTLRCYNQYTYNHSVNVSILSISLGNRAGYEKAALAELGLAALFHDVGRVFNVNDALDKSDEITNEKWWQIELHSVRGVISLAHLFGPRDFPSRLAAAAFEHHMNYDFSGYPKLGIPWEQSITGQIVMIADYYDLITSAHVQQRTLIAPEQALRAMLSESGKSFNPILLKLFVNCIGLIPIGSLVQLDSNELAVVMGPSSNPQTPDRPRVKKVTDVSGQPYVDPSGNPVGGPDVDLTEKDQEGQFKRSIIRVVDSTDYRFNTSPYFL
jgi:HD-GYP domain-containing protein (c-di-GMP phosphodiesterase class II)